MLSNYLKTALRNFKKHLGYSTINITGLAIGMACCLLILLFVQDELSFDRYNENVDRIQRIAGNFRMGGNDFILSTAPAPMAEVMVKDFPEIEDAVRIREKGDAIFRYKDKSFKEPQLMYADNSLFNVFTIPIIQGDDKEPLAAPNSMVISKRTVEKYFGGQNPIGKMIKLNNKDDYHITAVFDRIPANSHFQFDMVASLNTLEESRDQAWLSFNFFTYLLFKEGTSPESVASQFPEFIKRYLGPQFAMFLGRTYEELISSDDIRAAFSLQALTDIHLHSDTQYEIGINSDVKYTYIFSAIAIFILIIACINFMNLSTARSGGRAREIGIRKVMGSVRTQLVRQFLIESVLMSFLAMLTALHLVFLVLPSFNNLAGKSMSFSSLGSLLMVLILFTITLVTGCLAGSYPALLISAFRPVAVIKGHLKASKKSGFLRSGLVVFQFMASVVLIIGTIIVYNQLDYIQNKKLGFNKDQVIILRNTHLLETQTETFKNEILRHPRVVDATISGFLPVPSSRNNSAVFPEGKMDAKEATPMENWVVDHDYFSTMEMKIIEGRAFSRDFSTDGEAAILNQTAARQFGWDTPVGKRVGRIVSNKGDVKMYSVIGMVEDFHFDSLRNSIGPLVIYLGDSNSNISFRVKSEDIAGTIGFLKSSWDRFAPGQPFETTFMDERIDAIYRTEQRIGKIFATFAGLAIFIGCLGLFALAAFMAEQRTKEIGIRKVLGATVTSVVKLLSREFIILVGIANLIAWPIAFFIMKGWLQDFEYRHSISLLVFVWAVIGTMAIALLTVIYQAFRAALTNPADALKYE